MIPRLVSKFPACVGCGYCCLTAPCVLCRHRHGMVERCPELKWFGGRYLCMLAEDYEETLAIGQGCGRNMNSWRKEVKERE